MVITPRQLPPWTPDKTISGEWWPKGQPELRYPGELMIENGIFRLTVEAPPVGQEVFALGSAPTLYGTSESQHGVVELTLWDRAGHYLDHATNGTDHSRQVTHVIEGAHVSDYDVAVFGYSAVAFNDLGIWSRFQVPVAEGSPESQLPHHTVGILHPYRDLFETKYSVSVHLEYPGRDETTRRFPHGVMKNHLDKDARVVFEVTPPAPVLFHEFLVNDMQALLTFC